MKMGTIRSPWRYDWLAENRDWISRCPLSFLGSLLPIRLSHTGVKLIYPMTTHLPHSDKAILDIRKIEDYCLSPSHPRGRHKARVFREALGLQRSDAAWLRDVLIEAARSNEASQDAVDAWGTHWRLDATIRRQGKTAVVRTIWIVRTGETVPRFVTCWVL